MTDRHDELPTAEPAPMNYASPARPLPEGLAVAAMVLGIVGVASFCIFFISLPCSILGIVFGEIAYRRVNAGLAGGRGMAVAGIITGFVGVFLSLSTCVCSVLPNATTRADAPSAPVTFPGNSSSQDDSGTGFSAEFHIGSE